MRCFKLACCAVLVTSSVGLHAEGWRSAVPLPVPPIPVLSIPPTAVPDASDAEGWRSAVPLPVPPIPGLSIPTTAVPVTSEPTGMQALSCLQCGADSPVNSLVLFQIRLSSQEPLIPSSSHGEIERAVVWLQENPSRRLELHSYASGIQARELSARRARAFRTLMSARGISATKINLRALGSTSPPDDRIDLVAIH